MFRVSAEQFDELVERALAKIPSRFRKRLDNVAIVSEREPPRSPGRGELLGLYEGRPLTNRSVSDAFVMPDRITIFQGPHERHASTLAGLRRMVEDTVWHEVAHYFGMNELQVRSAESRRESERRLAKARRLARLGHQLTQPEQ